MSKFSWMNDWKDRASENIDAATKRLKKLLPVDNVAKTATSWFSVSDERVAEILTTVREKLPTTEALLIGKPQAGKKLDCPWFDRSIGGNCRTGFSSLILKILKDMAYPSEELPLLIFTDTVGLGDIDRNTQNIIEELKLELKQETQRARNFNSYR